MYLMQPLNHTALLSDIGMTPSLNRAPVAQSMRPLIPRTWHAAIIFFAALAIFASSIHAKWFEDEYAYIAQSFYADLFFTGRFHDPLWIEEPAADLQPLPKYLIGFAFRLAHLPMPGYANAWNWYDHYGRFGGIETLTAARLTVIPLGALGCLALFASGLLVKDARTATLAAVLLMINPLYSLLAHRSMADVPYEAFMLCSLAAALAFWTRMWARGIRPAAFVLPCIAGVLEGLSLVCKLNGFLGLAIVTSWCGIAWLVPSLSIGRKLAITCATIVTIALAIAVAVAFNPYLIARPGRALTNQARPLLTMNVWQRFGHQVKLRLETSELPEEANYNDDALIDLPERARVILMQGFGRFGLFGPREADSTQRYEFPQDWGMFLWLPLVLFGLRESVRLGIGQLRAGQPPAALALVVWAVCAWVVVTVYLPMAWDRYQLPIQSGNALLAAVGISALWDRLVRSARSRFAGARA